MNESKDQDLVAKALAALDHALDLFHDRILRPIVLVGRFVAFGFILFLLALVVFIALLLVLTRLLTIYAFAGRVWATYLLIGAVFCAGGVLLWRVRRPLRTRK